MVCLAGRRSFVDAHPFGLDLVYVHMDLNHKVRSASSIPSHTLIQKKKTDPLDGNFPPVAQTVCELLRRGAHRQVRLQGIDALLGLDTRYRRRTCALTLSLRLDRAHRKNFHLDAHDLFNSPFFDNSSSSGVGGWGDPENDYQIYTGGFKDQIRAYPTPHHIRRNFTLYPYANPNLVSPFQGDPHAPPSPATLMINVSMTRENVDYLVNGFDGNFIGFHAYLESVNVSLTFHHFLFRPS